MSNKKYILDQQVIEKKLRRMTLEILESNSDEKEVILVGIRDSGSVLASIIQKMINEMSNLRTELINLSLDKKNPQAIELSSDIDFNNRVVLIIDDVANSGKTLLYALKPFLSFQPKKIQTLVLVQRSHNSFPVYPDYIGLTIATTLQEHVFVEVNGDQVVGAYME